MTAKHKVMKLRRTTGPAAPLLLVVACILILLPSAALCSYTGPLVPADAGSPAPDSTGAGPGDAAVAEEQPAGEPTGPANIPHSPGDKNIRFTGSARFDLLDENSDGLMDALLMESEFVTSAEGHFGFFAQLWKDGDIVASGARYFMAAPITAGPYSGPAGIHTNQFRFSGEQIYLSGKDGPYLVWASAGPRKPDTGAGDVLEIETPPYSHLQFGEIGARVKSVSDSLIDYDDDGLFEALRATAEISVRAAGDYHTNFYLYSDAGPHNLGAQYRTTALTPGTHVVEADFDGGDISRQGTDGPWIIHVYLREYPVPVGEWPDPRNHTTPAYKASDFEPGPATMR
jgi:hypothetical protein